MAEEAFEEVEGPATRLSGSSSLSGQSFRAVIRTSLRLSGQEDSDQHDWDHGSSDWRKSRESGKSKRSRESKKSRASSDASPKRSDSRRSESSQKRKNGSMASQMHTDST